MARRPRIQITLTERIGAHPCHHGHKPGDTWDFDTERGKLCPMAVHVAFPLRRFRSRQRAWMRAFLLP